MSPDTKAAELASRYRIVLKFASGKSWRNWCGLLLATPEASRPFDSGDLDQWALEGLLILGGFLPGAENGRLAEYESKPNPEAYIQRSVNMFVAAKCQRAAEGFRAVKRGNGEAPEYLDTPVGDGTQTLADVFSAKGLETSGVALPQVAKRYPLLWMTGVNRVPDYQARKLLGLDPAEFEAQRAAEGRSLYQWAVRNRRVAKGTEAPVGRLRPVPQPGKGPCPYDDPECTGVHAMSRTRRAEACPSAWSRKMDRQRAAKRAA